MPSLNALKSAKSLNDVASLLRFKASRLSYILYKLLPAEKYETFLIPKRSGGHRVISAPRSGLKLLQRNLADLLQDCVDEINETRGRKDWIAHGFKRKRSIVSNARQHRHRRWILNLDLKDFFPSINFGRVRGFLLKNRDFQLEEGVATILAQIACHENSLPQGSPCSPVIANLVAHLLDMRVVKLAREVGCTYSRYADDLTFSTNKREFPVELAVLMEAEEQSSHSWRAGDRLSDIIARSGFRINEKKTRVMYKASRQEVTGLVVNQKISVRREYRREVRAMVDKLVKTGSFDVLGAVQKDGQTLVDKREGTLDELHGMLGFVDSIDAGRHRTAKAIPLNEMSSDEKTYRRFLFYRTFYAATSPVIICEGETDNVYLTHAILKLAPKFPDLAEVMPDGKVRLGVRLYKYSRSSTARLLGLGDGGSSVLSKFIGKYNKELGNFAGPGFVHPVVVVFDNDDGGAPIWSAIRSVTKNDPDKDAPFIHITKNLYAVRTPGSPSKIEDLFEEAVKEIKVEGKAFCIDGTFNAEKHYGKTIFAHKVVRPNADVIEFSGFAPFLENLAAAIRKHQDSVIPSPADQK